MYELPNLSSYELNSINAVFSTKMALAVNWDNPHAGFCWFGSFVWSPNGVGPVVNSFKYSSLCSVWLSRELSENPNQLSKVLIHLVIVFTVPCLRSWRHTALRLLWTQVLEPTDQPRVLGLNAWLSTSESHSSLTNALRPLSFLPVSRVHAGTALFLWSSR